MLVFLEFKKDTLKNGKLKKKKPLKISIFYPFFIDILVNNNKIILKIPDRQIHIGTFYKKSLYLVDWKTLTKHHPST